MALHSSVCAARGVVVCCGGICGDGGLCAARGVVVRCGVVLWCVRCAAIPIILVPDAYSSLITMHNARDFFESASFRFTAGGTAVAPSTPTGAGAGAAAAAAAGKKEEVVEIRRPSLRDPSKTVRYQIMDSTSRLNKIKGWKRVVAVFAHGAKWQFQGYPWDTPAQIFDNSQCHHCSCTAPHCTRLPARSVAAADLCPDRLLPLPLVPSRAVGAYHLHWDDEPLNPNIKEWKITKLKVSKTKRYQDRSTVLDFWHSLRDFIAAHPSKKYLNF